MNLKMKITIIAFATIYSIDEGYLSCRRKASDKEIEDATKLYSTMS